MKKKTRFVIEALTFTVLGSLTGALIRKNRKLRKENNILEGRLINSRHLIKGLQKNNEILNYNIGKMASKRENNQK